MHSLALVSPTGFSRRRFPRRQSAGAGLPALSAVEPWRVPPADDRASIRYFLRRTWGSRDIDEALADYDWLTARQPRRAARGLSFRQRLPVLARHLRFLSAAQTAGLAGPRDARATSSTTPRPNRCGGRPNWRLTVLETGALPHFERREEFLRGYDAFLAAVP
jgi:hypothetical protein